MQSPPLPAGLIRSVALLAGAGLTCVSASGVVIRLVAPSDLASVALLVGFAGLTTWAAAHVATLDRLAPAQAFAAGLILPATPLLLLGPRPARAANDNQSFNGSWPQFISE